MNKQTPRLPIIPNIESYDTFAGVPSKYWKVGLGVGIVTLLVWNFYKKGDIF